MPLATQLARKWGPKFGCPVDTLLTICKIESGYRVDCVESSPRAMLRGGAWGLMQQTLGTAKGHALALASSTDADVRATLRKWNGTGSSLLDPDLCMMFGARQLGTLTKEFGDFPLVAGAYHQGAGKIRQMLKDKKAIPGELPPKGKLYVTRAIQVHGSLTA